MLKIKIKDGQVVSREYYPSTDGREERALQEHANHIWADPIFQEIYQKQLKMKGA